ncbi:CBO0543 family protein [Neobacillus sp. NRS-1170]|uniref:CBO0543 family protein n=1 Tax=Neobacillus sp. NRS-1170 TaxID=3233898 RepID=UPI003D2C1D22
MNVILFIVYGFIGWKFGNWKEFKSLYPTLLFLIIGDFLSQFLLFDYTMWMFRPLGPLDNFFHLNHTLIALGKMLIQYPVTIAVFLGRMNPNKKSLLISIVLWSVIYSITEKVAQISGILTYHHGWNYGWDLVFNVMIFLMLFIHYKKPVLAWVLVVPIILGLWWIFDVPFSVLK